MKANKSTAVELSYFRLSLLSYLRESHPDKADDKQFIAVRGDAAAEEYSRIIKLGGSHDEAEETASQILYAGLHFSPYRTIVNILWDYGRNRSCAGRRRGNGVIAPFVGCHRTLHIVGRFRR